MDTKIIGVQWDDSEEFTVAREKRIEQAQAKAAQDGPKAPAFSETYGVARARYYGFPTAEGALVRLAL